MTKNGDDKEVGMDRASKESYKNKEVLDAILKGVVREFEPYSYGVIMDFI